jgi:5-methylcytosine-specific restriction endonuclease McrA
MLLLWNKIRRFYSDMGKILWWKIRGQKFEMDRRGSEKGYTLENCVLSCSICNNAKSDKFTERSLKM